MRTRAAVRSFCLLMFCLLSVPDAAMGQGPRADVLHPRTKADYGSGATVQTDWYGPGGLGPGVGVFVGHPNALSRSDRALVRFDLARYLRPAFRDIPVRRASLHFCAEYFHGKADLRRIEVSHLGYDALVLDGNDTVNADAKPVGVVSVHRGTATSKRYTLDVTRCVREDFWKGNRYSAFRFRDVDAEARGNPDMAPTGMVLYLRGSLPSLEIQAGP